MREASLDTRPTTTVHKAVFGVRFAPREVIHRPETSCCHSITESVIVVVKSHQALRDGGDTGESRTSPYRDRAREATRARSPQSQQHRGGCGRPGTPARPPAPRHERPFRAAEPSGRSPWNKKQSGSADTATEPEGINGHGQVSPRPPNRDPTQPEAGARSAFAVARVVLQVLELLGVQARPDPLYRLGHMGSGNHTCFQGLAHRRQCGLTHQGRAVSGRVEP